MIAGFNPDHPSWLVLREDVEGRIDRLVEALCTPGLDQTQTEHARGQIAALRQLISDVEQKPVEAISAPSYG